MSTAHIAARAPLDWTKTGRFCAAAFLMDFGGGVHFVARPFLAMRFGASDWQLGMLGLIWGITYAIATPVAGFIADRVNRKVQILLSALLSAVVVFGMGFADSLRELYVLEFLHALVFAFHWPAFFGWLGDAHFKSQLGRATALFNVSWSVGGMLGAPVGGVFYSMNPRLPFFASAVPVVVAFAIVSTLKWKSTRIAQEHRPPDEARETPKRILAAVWISTFATFIVIGLLSVVFPKLGETELGIDADLYGWLSSMQGLTRTLIFVIGIWFGHKLCNWRLTGVAQFGVAACVAGVAFIASPAWIGLTMAVVGLSMGLNYYRGLYTSLEGSSGGGLKSGIHEGMLFAGYVIGSTGGGALIRVTGNMRAPYVPIGIVVLVFLTLQIVLMSSARRRYGKWSAFNEAHQAPPRESASAAPSGPSECRTPPDSPAE